MNKLFSASLLALSLVTTSATAFAQRAPTAYATPVQTAVAPRGPAYVAPAQVQARGATMDDRRDVREFAALRSQFEQAVTSNNVRAIRTAIENFARAGRIEVAELQNEARQARWTGGNHRAEFAKIQRATQLVAELDRATQLVGNRRTNPGAINSARQAMNGFNQLALSELHTSMRAARVAR